MSEMRVIRARAAFARPVTTLIVAVLHVYRGTVSRILGARCRFYPSCSHFAEEAVLRWGVGRGGWMTLKRLACCHPLSSRWGNDPVKDI